MSVVTIGFVFSVRDAQQPSQTLVVQSFDSPLRIGKRSRPLEIQKQDRYHEGLVHIVLCIQHGCRRLEMDKK